MRSYVVAAIAGLALSGCATTSPGSLLARHFGGAAGGAAAQLGPPPAANTAPVQRGGNFCDTALALGAPLPPAGPRRQYEFITAVDEYGEKTGCWKAK